MRLSDRMVINRKKVGTKAMNGSSASSSWPAAIMAPQAPLQHIAHPDAVVHQDRAVEVQFFLQRRPYFGARHFVFRVQQDRVHQVPRQ